MPLRGWRCAHKKIKTKKSKSQHELETAVDETVVTFLLNRSIINISRKLGDIQSSVVHQYSNFSSFCVIRLTVFKHNQERFSSLSFRVFWMKNIICNTLSLGVKLVNNDMVSSFK